MSDLTEKSTGETGVGPRSRDVSAFPGAPGVPGGVKSANAGPVAASVVGNNDFLQGGPSEVATSSAFPGYTGDTWQGYQPGDGFVSGEPGVNEQPGHVSGGIRVSHPSAFYPGLGQGV